MDSSFYDVFVVLSTISLIYYIIHPMIRLSNFIYCIYNKNTNKLKDAEYFFNKLSELADKYRNISILKDKDKYSLREVILDSNHIKTNNRLIAIALAVSVYFTYFHSSDSAPSLLTLFLLAICNAVAVLSIAFLLFVRNKEKIALYEMLLFILEFQDLKYQLMSKNHRSFIKDKELIQITRVLLHFKEESMTLARGLDSEKIQNISLLKTICAFKFAKLYIFDIEDFKVFRSALIRKSFLDTAVFKNQFSFINFKLVDYHLTIITYFLKAIDLTVEDFLATLDNNDKERYSRAFKLATEPESEEGAKA